jgi:hypothetical protein
VTVRETRGSKQASSELRTAAAGEARPGAGRTAGWTAVRPREYHIAIVRGRPVLAGSGSPPGISDEASMEIRFPAGAPAYRDSNLTVVFSALVDGEPVPCAISVEALEDHFGARSEDLEGWMRAFDAGRPRIEAVAREHLQISNGTPVLLRSGHFPPGSAAG